MNKFNDVRDWFFEKRFGLFIHWGLYAIPAWHEQILWRRNMMRKEYEQLMYEFNPTEFDPEVWLDLAESAGMQYLTFTVKHHDGFCMWNSKYTDYKITNAPYKKDILAMLADACHHRNFPLCLYYSVVDWHHPNYPNQGRHHEIPPQPEDAPHMEKYMEYLKDQIRELCTNYGEIHGIWWDMNVLGHRDPSVHAMIRRLQTQAVINDRGFENGIMHHIANGDFTTLERHLPEGKVFRVPTEACQSVGSLSWGYKKDEDYFSDKFLMQSIDRILAMGGNYLLNIGPDAKGVIHSKPLRILQNIGNWFNQAREALLAEPVSEMTQNSDVFLTRHDKCLYVHLNPDSHCEMIKLYPINKAPAAATLLNDGRRLEWTIDADTQPFGDGKEGLRIRNIPVNEFSHTVMIIRLEFKKPYDFPAIKTPIDGLTKEDERLTEIL